MTHGKKYLLFNRLLIALLALCAIWTNTPFSEVFATASTLLWIFLSDAIKLEKKCCSKLRGNR